MCCRARTCCGCCGLDVGVYVIAAFTLVVSALQIGSGAYTLSMFLQVGLNVPSFLGMIIAYLALPCLWFISAILLIVGGVKRQRGFLVTWMVVTIIVLVLYGIFILGGVIAIALWGTLGNQLLQMLAEQSEINFKPMVDTIFIAAICCVVVMALIFALWIYATVIVCSFHSELRDEQLGVVHQQFPMQPGYNPGYNQPTGYNQDYNQGYKDPYQRV